jgi:hypothetical protein
LIYKKETWPPAYLATEPEERRWRGPYISRAELERYCFRELGESTFILDTPPDSKEKQVDTSSQ